MARKKTSQSGNSQKTTRNASAKKAAAKKFVAMKAKMPTSAAQMADPNTIFQFKITLRYSDPPIWRRIQTEDCTLNTLHCHIQDSMGWTNSHCHIFEFGNKKYAIPEMMQDHDLEDTTEATISDFLPVGRRKFRFYYEYDFGDCWKHEIEFEGCVTRTPRKKYPICLEGERACPPEDCGGLHGFYNHLDAIKDPDHEMHDDSMEWFGPFREEKFSAKVATRRMQRGFED